MAFTRVLGPGIHTEADIKTNSINATGIITATGGFDGPFTKLNVTGDVVVGGALTVGGVLTYEDVTNVDAIGIITARSGVDITSGRLNVGVGATVGFGSHVDLPQGARLRFGGKASGADGLQIFNKNNGTQDYSFVSSNDTLFLQSSLGPTITLSNTFSKYLSFTSTDSFYVKTTSSGTNAKILETDTQKVKLNYIGDTKLETSDKGVVVGTGVTIETNGQATYTGIVTALDFQKADGSSLGVGAGGTWGSYSAGIATSKSVGINTTNLDDTRITGVGNSFNGLYISNGMMVNDARLDGDHFIGADVNGMMVGPVNVTGTLTVEGNYVVF